MLLKFGTILIFHLTLQASESFVANPNLGYKNSTLVPACVGNQNIEVVISEDLTCRVRVVPGPSSYKLHVVAETWFEARRICANESSHLAVINSIAQEKVILDLFKREQKPIVNTYRKDLIWLGAHNLWQSEWMTVFGDSLSSAGYVNWSKGCDGYPPEPNNVDGNEQCLSLYDGRCQGLNDYNCEYKLAFVCEKYDACS